jgi:hypothetical protein
MDVSSARGQPTAVHNEGNHAPGILFFLCACGDRHGDGEEKPIPEFEYSRYPQVDSSA